MKLSLHSIEPEKGRLLFWLIDSNIYIYTIKLWTVMYLLCLLKKFCCPNSQWQLWRWWYFRSKSENILKKRVLIHKQPYVANPPLHTSYVEFFINFIRGNFVNSHPLFSPSSFPLCTHVSLTTHQLLLSHHPLSSTTHHLLRRPSSLTIPIAIYHVFNYPSPPPHSTAVSPFAVTNTTFVRCNTELTTTNFAHRHRPHGLLYLPPTTVTDLLLSSSLRISSCPSHHFCSPVSQDATITDMKRRRGCVAYLDGCGYVAEKKKFVSSEMGNKMKEGGTQWRKIECYRIKQRINFFDFLSLDHYEFTHELVIRLLPRSVESESWKLESRSQQSEQQAVKPLASPHERCSSKTRC